LKEIKVSKKRLYRLTKQAEKDIAAMLEEGFKNYGEQGAIKYRNELVETFDHIAQWPFANRERENYSPPARIKPYGSHIIMYRIEDNVITIVRVRHGREDW